MKKDKRGEEKNSKRMVQHKLHTKNTNQENEKRYVS